jgi:hypothetical protein
METPLRAAGLATLRGGLIAIVGSGAGDKPQGQAGGPCLSTGKDLARERIPYTQKDRRRQRELPFPGRIAPLIAEHTFHVKRNLRATPRY